MTAHAQPHLHSDGESVRALQFDGRIAGFFALLQAFPGRIEPHAHRDDAALVIMDSGARVRITAGDWVVERSSGSLMTEPDDQFHIGHHQPKAIAA